MLPLINLIGIRPSLKKKAKKAHVIKNIVSIPPGIQILLLSQFFAQLSVSCLYQNYLEYLLNTKSQDFSGGSVVKNVPANAGDMGSVCGMRGSHKLWSSSPAAPLLHHHRACVP